MQNDMYNSMTSPYKPIIGTLLLVICFPHVVGSCF